MKNNLEYFCILGGGGIRGCSYTGVLKAIEELNLEITGWAGSSIGAVVAALYAFNYTIDEINEVFEAINTQQASEMRTTAFYDNEQINNNIITESSFNCITDINKIIQDTIAYKTGEGAMISHFENTNPEKELITLVNTSA